MNNFKYFLDVINVNGFVKSNDITPIILWAFTVVLSVFITAIPGTFSIFSKNASSFAPAIVAALASKGVAVPAGTKISGLAALIESIQTGGAVVEQVSFTIDDGGSNSETFSVVSGTTWAEWIGTVRLIFNNSLELYIYGGRVTTEAGVYAVSLDGSTAVSGSDKIVSGATYTIINWGG